MLDKLPLVLLVMAGDLLREALLLIGHIQLVKGRLLLLKHGVLLIDAALPVARMIREEKREVVPKVWLCLHLPDDLADVLVEVITQGKHAH